MYIVIVDCVYLTCNVTATEIQNLDSLPAGTVITECGLVARMLGTWGVLGEGLLCCLEHRASSVLK
jgi:hypothetical protein